MNAKLLKNEPLFESLFIKYQKIVFVFPVVVLLLILGWDFEQNKSLKELKYEREILTLTQDKLFLQNQLNKTNDQLTKNQVMLEMALNNYK